MKHWFIVPLIVTSLCLTSCSVFLPETKNKPESMTQEDNHNDNTVQAQNVSEVTITQEDKERMLDIYKKYEAAFEAPMNDLDQNTVDQLMEMFTVAKQAGTTIAGYHDQYSETNKELLDFLVDKMQLAKYVNINEVGNTIYDILFYVVFYNLHGVNKEHLKQLGSDTAKLVKELSGVLSQNQ